MKNKHSWKRSRQFEHIKVAIAPESLNALRDASGRCHCERQVTWLYGVSRKNGSTAASLLCSSNIRRKVGCPGCRILVPYHVTSLRGRRHFSPPHHFSLNVHDGYSVGDLIVCQLISGLHMPQEPSASASVIDSTSGRQSCKQGTGVLSLLC